MLDPAAGLARTQRQEHWRGPTLVLGGKTGLTTIILVQPDHRQTSPALSQQTEEAVMS